jgi:hypothetical protein
VTGIFNHLEVDPTLLDDDYHDFNVYLCTPLQAAASEDQMGSETAQESLPPGWTTEKDTDGNVYYYNARTGESQWDIPTQ